MTKKLASPPASLRDFGASKDCQPLPSLKSDPDQERVGILKMTKKLASPPASLRDFGAS